MKNEQGNGFQGCHFLSLFFRQHLLYRINCFAQTAIQRVHLGWSSYMYHIIGISYRGQVFLQEILCTNHCHLEVGPVRSLTRTVLNSDTSNLYTYENRDPKFELLNVKNIKKICIFSQILIVIPSPYMYYKKQAPGGSGLLEVDR